MRTFIIVTVIAWVYISTGTLAQTQVSGMDTLTVYAGSFSSDSGQAVAMLFRKEDDVPKKPFMKANETIKEGKSIMLFADIPFGEYAVIVFHDENSNGILDHNWLGLPKEPLGFSNDWKLTIFSGMPSFSKLKFEFSDQHPDCKINVK